MDSLIRIKQLQQQEVSGYIVDVIQQYLRTGTVSGVASNTGQLTGQFYPLRQNPSGYITSGQTGVFATRSDVTGNNAAILASLGNYYPRSNPSGFTSVYNAFNSGNNYYLSSDGPLRIIDIPNGITVFEYVPDDYLTLKSPNAGSVVHFGFDPYITGFTIYANSINGKTVVTPADLTGFIPWSMVNQGSPGFGNYFALKDSGKSVSFVFSTGKDYYFEGRHAKNVSEKYIMDMYGSKGTGYGVPSGQPYLYGFHVYTNKVNVSGYDVLTTRDITQSGLVLYPQLTGVSGSLNDADGRLSTRINNTGQLLQSGIKATGDTLSARIAASGSYLYHLMTGITGLTFSGSFSGNLNNVVYTSGTQTISGTKYFSGSSPLSVQFINGFMVGPNGSIALFDSDGYINFNDHVDFTPQGTSTFSDGNIYFSNSGDVKLYQGGLEVAGQTILHNVSGLEFRGTDVYFKSATITNTATANNFVAKTAVSTPYVTSTGGQPYIDVNNRILSGDWTIKDVVRTYGNQGIYGDKQFRDAVQLTGEGDPFVHSGRGMFDIYHLSTYTNADLGVGLSPTFGTGAFLSDGPFRDLTFYVRPYRTGSYGRIYSNYASYATHTEGNTDTTYFLTVTWGPDAYAHGYRVTIDNPGGLGHTADINYVDTTGIYITYGTGIAFPVLTENPMVLTPNSFFADVYTNEAGQLLVTGYPVLTQSDSGSFISRGQTGTFASTGWVNQFYYPRSNPSGYLTSASAGGVQNIKVGNATYSGTINLSGTNGVAVVSGGPNTIVISGTGTASINEFYLVHRTGNEVVSGSKTFTQGGILSGTWSGQNFIIPGNINTSVSTLYTNIDTANVARFNWSNGDFRDSLNKSVISLDSRQLYDDNGNTVVNWKSQSLVTGGKVTLDWSSRIFSGNWTGTNITVPEKMSTITSALFADGWDSLNWASRLANDSAGNTAIDWQNRELLNTDSVATVGWVGCTLSPTDGSISVDWSNHRLCNDTSSPTLEWQSRILSGLWTAQQFQCFGQSSFNLITDSMFGDTIIDVPNRRLYNSQPYASVDWEAHMLGHDGITSVNWESNVLSGTWDVEGLTVAGKKVPFVAKYANITGTRTGSYNLFTTTSPYILNSLKIETVRSSGIFTNSGFAFNLSGSRNEIVIDNTRVPIYSSGLHSGRFISYDADLFANIVSGGSVVRFNITSGATGLANGLNLINVYAEGFYT